MDSAQLLQTRGAGANTGSRTVDTSGRGANAVTASPPTRREFLRTAGRWTAAGALAGGVALVIVRNGAAECLRPALCGDCPVFTGCDFPKAEQYRRLAAGIAPDQGGVPRRSM